MLEDFDQKIDGGEDLHVGVEIVVAGSAIDYGVRAARVDEQFLQGDRRANDVVCERLASLSGASRNADRCVYREATGGPIDRVIG